VRRQGLSNCSRGARGGSLEKCQIKKLPRNEPRLVCSLAGLVRASSDLSGKASNVSCFVRVLVGETLSFACQKMETTTAAPLGSATSGRVLSFCSTRGYGFIEDVNSGSTVFVHYTSLARKTPGFRCLWSGEYVDFLTLQDALGRPSARFVTGIKGGPLMCETREATAVAPSVFSAA